MSRDRRRRTGWVARGLRARASAARASRSSMARIRARSRAAAASPDARSHWSPTLSILRRFPSPRSGRRASPTVHVSAFEIGDAVSALDARHAGSRSIQHALSSRAATGFDAALLSGRRTRRRGARIRSRVTDVHADATGATLDHRRTAALIARAFVIGADGANSLVRRRLATPFRRDQLSIATGFFAHGRHQRRDRHRADRPIRPATSGRSRGRTIWRSASARRRMPGISAAALRATRRGVDRTQRGSPTARRSSRTPGRFPRLSARDFDALELAGPRWALVGDAAGLVDPITREGIFFAIASGQWIAEALAAGGADVRAYRGARARRGDRASWRAPRG